MVKGFVSADLHLGVSMWGGINPETGLNRMVEKFIDELDKTATKVIEGQYNVWIIVGDIFHTRTPSNAVREEFARIISRVLSHGIEVIIVLGNHDIQTTLGARDSLAEIRALHLERLHIVDMPSTISVAGCTFVCLPWRKKASEVLAYSGGLKNVLPKAEATFVLGHFSVEGAVTGAEKYFELQDSEAVPLSAVTGPGIDFTFLGHIHKAQMLGDKAAYIGSMDRVDFSERNEPKGGMSFEVGPQGVKVEYVLGTPQKYFQYERDLIQPSNENEVDFFENARDAVVKVRVRCTQDQKKMFDHAALAENLKGARFVMPLVFDVEKADALRKNEGLDRDVRWQDALKIWLDKQVIEPEMKQAVIVRSAELFAVSEEMK